MRRAEPDLSSAPPPGLAPDDHVRGDRGPVVIVYGDYECPHCARTELLLRALPVRQCFRHFPVTSKHPRSRVLAHATEAARLQGAFWAMHDSLFSDQGHLDDPHLWERVRSLRLDLDRFERDRRSDAVKERVERDFRAGIRAGVVATPTLVIGGEIVAGISEAELRARLA